MGNDGTTLLWVSAGSLAGMASPGIQLQACYSADLLGYGLISVPLTPSGKGGKSSAAHEH